MQQGITIYKLLVFQLIQYWNLVQKFIFLLNSPKTDLLKIIFDRLSSLMLPQENDFSAKFLIMVFNGKIFSVVHHSCEPRF